jgi:hypothetical protein
MSFQITVLKVLAGHPGGRASLADLRRAVAILISSGSDWTDRTKRLAARAPGLDIFTQSFVLRDEAGWLITDAGRAFLASLEMPIQVSAGEEQPPEDLETLVPPALPQVRLVSLNRRRRRAARRRRPAAA